MSAVGKWAAVAWALPVTGVVASAWVSLVPVSERVPTSRLASLPAPSLPGIYPTDSLGDFVVRRDPFRAGRRPAEVVYDPAGSAATAPADIPPKPELVLSGIVWGVIPAAVLEGLPGLPEPRVVREGEVVGGLRIRRITRDRVVITGMDTLWTLTVREPWK